MKTKNTKPRPRTKPPLFVFKFKIGQFTWIAACRRCSFAKGYYSHPLALKAALSHHSKCLNTQSAPDLYGWIELQSLWSEGEVPLIRKTADQLEPGTEFYGVLKTSEPDGVAPELLLRTQGHVLHLDDYTISQMSPRHFEVVSVVGMYGTFRNSEVN